MRFLLDENIPKDVAVALRSEGHDVVWMVETPKRGAEDEVVWAWAVEEERILVTADLDFPRGRKSTAGIILARRIDRISTARLALLIVDAVLSHGDKLTGALVVVSPGRVRSRRL